MKQHKSKFNSFLKEFNIYNKLRKNFEAEIVKNAQTMLDKYVEHYKKYLSFNSSIEDHKALFDEYIGLCENINYQKGRMIESKWLELNVDFEALKNKWSMLKKDFNSLMGQYMGGSTHKSVFSDEELTEDMVTEIGFGGKKIFAEGFMDDISN